MNSDNNEKTPSERIREMLDKTNLSESAKADLGKKSEEIYQQLKSIGGSKEEKINVANALACDQTFCAIPKQLPETSTKLRKKARKITGILPVVDPVARTDKTLKLLRNNFYEGKSIHAGNPVRLISGTEVGDIVEKKSREIIDAYIKKYSEMRATVPSDSVTTTGAAYYISSALTGFKLTLREVADVLGFNEPTLGNRYREMADTLRIEFPQRGYWKHSNKR